MSIKMIPGAARLTVLGSGWSNSSIESGDGLTEDGQLWEDIAGDLGYDFGEDVDWDQISGDTGWADDIYVDDNGNEWLPEDDFIEISIGLESVEIQDKILKQYAIDAAILKTLYGGKVTEEPEGVNNGNGRPHQYSPGVYYIQRGALDAVLFLGEPFYHSDANGGNLTVNDESVTIRDGSTKSVYWSECSTFFSANLLPSKYKSIPIQYICWQCLHGSFNHVLVSSNPNTITTSMIQAGEVQYETMTIDGKTYYKLIR